MLSVLVGKCPTIYAAFISIKHIPVNCGYLPNESGMYFLRKLLSVLRRVSFLCIYLYSRHWCSKRLLIKIVPVTFSLFQDSLTVDEISDSLWQELFVIFIFRVTHYYACV